jgi:hypothetical protein
MAEAAASIDVLCGAASGIRWARSFREAIEAYAAPDAATTVTRLVWSGQRNLLPPGRCHSGPAPAHPTESRLGVYGPARCA